MQLPSIADREAFLSDILNQAIAAIGRYRIYAEGTLDSNGNCPWCIDYLSPGHEILYGYPPEEFIANPNLWRTQVHPEDWQTCILPNLALVYSVQGTASRTITAEYRIYHKDGNLRWISENLTIRRDELAGCWTITSLAIDITQHKQAEINPQQSEHLYASLTAAVPVGIFRTDAAGNCWYVNDRWCEISGLTPEMAMGRGWVEGLHPDDQQPITEEWERAVQNKLPFSMEYRFRWHKDGTVIWVYGQSIAERGKDGAITGYVGTITDITARKQTEILLEVQNRILAQIARGEPLSQILNSLMEAIKAQLDGALCSILLLDATGKLRHAAAPHLPQAYIQAVDGTLPGEGTGSCGTAVFRRERVIVPDIATDSLWQNCKDVPLQYGLRACWAMPILTQEGRVLGTFEVYYREVKSPHFAELEVVTLAANIAGIAIVRYQFEMALQDSEAKSRAINDELEAKIIARTVELQAQKEFLQRVIDSVPSCIFVKDAEGYIQVVNQATADLYGTTVEETLGKRLTDFDSHLSSAQRDIFNLEDQTVVQTGQPLVKQDYVVTRGQQTRWYQTTLKPFVDRQGQIQGLIGNSVDITDRKLAELALQQSEETLRLVVQNMPVMLDAYDANGNLIVWNRECERVTGFTADEIIHSPHCLKLLYPDPTYLTQMLAKWTENGNDFRDWEWEITCKDGTRKTILWSNVSEEFPIAGWAGWAVGIDISDRKRIETALQESEARYRRIVETAGEGVWVLDTEHKTTFVNDRMAQLLGTTVDFMLGQTLFDFMDEEGKRLAATYLARRHQGIAEQYDFKFTRLDGSDLWVIVETTPIQDADGCYQGTLAMMTDITDRKHIEDQLRNLSDRLSLAIKSGAIGIWDRDLIEDVSVWDDRMCELFGVPRSEFTGCFQTWLQAIHPDDRATVVASTEQALRGEKDYDTEFRVVHLDGSIRFIKAYGVVQRNEVGEAIRMIGINLDISDRKQAEEKLREANHTLELANTELARANRLKDEFLANMSHELRTPLNAVLGLSQILREEAFGPLNNKQHQFVDNILSSGNHLLSLINDILDLAKIESGKFELERSPTSIHSLCEASLNFVRPQAQQKHIFLETKLPPESPMMLLDERRMRQVLINLLSNGVKFTPEGGRVTLRVLNLSPYGLLFAVEDTGIGIADEDLNKLFQPFVQIDSSLSRLYEGTGLGLVLMKQIVELHGGQVGVTSELGKGSCFTVSIPCSNLSQEQPHPSTLPLPHLPLILLVEDNRGTQELLQDYLQVNGFRVILAENGIEALHIAQTHLPQMILMDIQMPEMDGLEAIQRLKANPKTAMIPVIAVTASVMRGDRERCIVAGASDYLSKPIQLHQLVAKLNDWLPFQVDWPKEPL